MVQNQNYLQQNVNVFKQTSQLRNAVHCLLAFTADLGCMQQLTSD